MFKKLRKEGSGFTIIEVLIVLAIAGLIMLIVFLAVPALQRNQRNNARNAEASRISAAATECIANRNGVTASCTSAVLESGAGARQQLSGTIAVANGGTTAPVGDTDNAAVWYQKVCTTDGSGVSSVAVGGTATPNNPVPTLRDFAVTWTNEPNITRCVGSQ